VDERDRVGEGEKKKLGIERIQFFKIERMNGFGIERIQEAEIERINVLRIETFNEMIADRGIERSKIFVGNPEGQLSLRARNPGTDSQKCRWPGLACRFRII
jgi:hypothetical protein